MIETFKKDQNLHKYYSTFFFNTVEYTKGKQIADNSTVATISTTLFLHEINFTKKQNTMWLTIRR